MPLSTNEDDASFDQKADNPKIRMIDPEGRSITLTNLTPNDYLPTIVENDETPIDGLLREHVVNGEKGPFMPHKLLLQILSRKRVLNKLRECKGLANATSYIDTIRPVHDHLTEIDFTETEQNGMTHSRTHT